MKPRSLTFIRALAEEYARKYNPDNVAPFPYENIQKEHDDLEVYFATLEEDSVSGVTLFKDGRFNIIINANKPAVRQNFTLGHELGHYFLHQDILHEERGIIDGDNNLNVPTALYRLDDAESQHIETEANNFAASLLMPADLAIRGWRTVGDVEELARIFNVSVVAMSLRLTQLGLVK